MTERFETAPGHQAQFVWSPYTVELGGRPTRIIVYGMTLGYSRRKHYTASLDETQASIFEAVEARLWHFQGVPKEVLVDNTKAFVLDANPAHFRWNPQFLELCGHYRLKPRACQVGRAQTKGKIERPFFSLEQQFIKGRSFASFPRFLDELAAFERDDLDVRVHSTTRERPIDRFAQEVPHPAALPERRILGTLALSGKVSWDCLVSFRGSRYSVPAAQAGQRVWLLVSRGSELVVLDGRREVSAPHPLSATKGATIVQAEHYAGVRRGTPCTLAVLAEQFLARFPHHAAFLTGLLARHQENPAAHLRGVMELADLYEPAQLAHALTLAHEYRSSAHGLVRGLLERAASPAVPDPAAAPLLAVRMPPATAVHCDLGAYQRILEAAR